MGYSQELWALYKEICATDDIRERRGLLMDLARIYAHEHDDTEHEIIDDCHEVVENYEKAHQEFLHASLQLGRFVMMFLDAESVDGIVDEEKEANFDVN